MFKSAEISCEVRVYCCKMACLITLKQEIRTLESIFPKTNNRFQILNASVDEINCRFLGNNGKKYDIHANITVSTEHFFVRSLAEKLGESVLSKDSKQRDLPGTIGRSRYLQCTPFFTFKILSLPCFHRKDENNDNLLNIYGVMFS